MTQSAKAGLWAGALFGAAIALPGVLMGCRIDVALVATVVAAAVVALFVRVA